MSEIYSPTSLIFDSFAHKEKVSMDIGDVNFDELQYLDIIGSIALEGTKLNMLHYTETSGTYNLRQAILKAYVTAYYDYNEANVTVTSGGKQAVYCAMAALLKSTDEIIIFKPYWPAYISIAKALNLNVVIVDTTLSNYKIDMDIVQENISENTKMIIINNPNNPTGIVQDLSIIDKLIDFCRSRDIYILSDEVYITPYKKESYSILSCPSSMSAKEYILVVNSLSKTFAISGLRLGWLIADTAVIKKVSAIQSIITTSPCSLSQYIGERLLTEHMQYSIKIDEELSIKRSKAIKILTNNLKVLPNVGPYILIKTALGAVETSKILYDMLRVTVMPGNIFGLDDCIRVSLLPKTEILEKYLYQIEKYLNNEED